VKPILLDTGVIVAMLDRSERHHQACCEKLSGLTGVLTTTEPVIAEACYLLRGLPGAAETVLSNVEEGIFQIPLRLADAAGPIKRLMRKYRDVPIDLADACLIHLAAVLETDQILTLDRDFLVYRWGRRKTFRLLIDVIGASAAK